MTAEILLSVAGLSVDYLTGSGALPACVNVSFDLRPGEFLGIAGESGSGKSTLITALLRLQRPPAVTVGGRIDFVTSGRGPVDLAGLTEQDIRALRWRDLSIVMQSAMDCLNPVMRLQDQFEDAIQAHERGVSRAASADRTRELLRMVGIPADRARSYPHELSGGMRQRALIALALACDPRLVVLDEPTTAVDVVMQRQILGQLLELQERLGFAVILVTHDLPLLFEVADRIAIMYAGRLVEIGPAQQLLADPLHPYTRALGEAFPRLDEPWRKRTGLAGSPPDLHHLPSGCGFADRCDRVMPTCRRQRPPDVAIGDRQVACFLHTSGDRHGE